MFARCLGYEEHEQLATKQLGFVYKDQGRLDLAIEFFKKALEMDSTFDMAFEVGKIYFKLEQLTEALDYFTYSIDMALGDVLKVKPEELS